MPASVSKAARQSDPANTSAQPADADTTVSRAARSAGRVAQLTAGTTPDLFAEDIERATLQAMNTDIRQGTLAGFELPEVFMAAVASGVCGQAESAMQTRRSKTPDAEKTQPDDERQVFDRMLEGFESPSAANERGDEDDRAPTLLAVKQSNDDHRRPIPSEMARTRRTNTMLTIIVCAMLMTVATGIAQTLLLMRMNRESVLQQHRIEQLMLNQEATLSALFDTDSANFGTMRH